MSYGNYYTMQRDFTDGEWNQLRKRTIQIINAAILEGIELVYILIDTEEISICGGSRSHCETFFLSKYAVSKDTRCSCTTNRFPYDKVVKSILYEASQLAPDVFEGLFCDDEPIYGGYKDRDTIYWQFQNYFKETE